MNTKLGATVLIVEDERAQRRLISQILRREGFEVAEAPDLRSARQSIEAGAPDIILSDWRLPDGDGGALLQWTQDAGFDASFIVMTAYGSISHAVQALKLGANDYLSKPFEREALVLAVRRAHKTRSLEQENRRLKEAIFEQDRFGDILGRTDAMQALYRTLKKVATADVTVLITGESGTGKELVAKTLHAESRRAHGPFVALNCAAIPENLIESELFGHEKGAFTGAYKRRQGKLAEAGGGTLFLDEIPSMPLPLQGTLLRVLQERKYTPLGGQGEVACDVRVVAASNRDLKKMVREGSFREDLYYRLNVVPLRVPPLRQRRDDIPLLARALAEGAARRHGTGSVTLSPKALAAMMTYGWPGNVRELGNVVERLVLLSDGSEIGPQDLPEEIRSPVQAEATCPFRLPPTGIRWEEVEAGLLRQALDMAAGNRSQAAKLMGLSYKTFLYRLDKFDLA